MSGVSGDYKKLVPQRHARRMHHPTPGHVPRDIPVKEKKNGAVEVRNGDLPDLRVERVPAVLGRVQLVGEEDDSGHGPHARPPRRMYPNRLQYLRVFDAEPLASYGRSYGAVQEYRHPRFQGSDLYTETLGQEDQFLGALGPSKIVEQSRGAHHLDVKPVNPCELHGYILNPQDVLNQALGKPPDVAPDLLDCGLGDGHLGLAQLPRKLPAPEDVHMQVPDGLASLIAAVDGESVSLIENTFPSGHVVGNDGHVPGQRGVPGLNLPDRLQVLGGQDEKVNGGLGIDVPDDDDLLVPVEDLGGNIPRDDFAEDAVHTGGCPGG